MANQLPMVRNTTRMAAMPVNNATVLNDQRLGTAAWHTGEGRAFLQYKHGDFWLGYQTNGVPTGLRDNRHILLTAGTRGGKGASLILPNLALYPGSVVVLDPKGENAMVTARRRGNGSTYCEGMGQKVRILDPLNVVQRHGDYFGDLKVRFNPLDLIDPNHDDAIDEAARIADALIVSEGSKDPYWEDSARGLLKALILHVASSPSIIPSRRNLVTVRSLLLAGDVEARRIAQMSAEDKKVPSARYFLFCAMQRSRAFGGVLANAGEMFASLETSSPRTMAIITQVAATNTEFIESMGMRRVLEASDFALSELKTDPKGTSLYLCLPQRAMETHYRWLRMMAALVITEMEKIRHHPVSGHPVLMVLDEFPALRRMRVIENAAAQIAGFGVRMVFVTQTLAQLKDIYKDNWETLIANAGTKLFFCNDDHFTREYVSKLIGECEVMRTASSTSQTQGQTDSFSTGLNLGTSVSNAISSTGNSNGSMSSTASHTTGYSTSRNYSSSNSYSQSSTRGLSESVHKRPLVTPDEIGRLFGDVRQPAMLALISGHQPIYVKRIFYYAWEFFEGTYDWHPDYLRPLTLQARTEKRLEKERLEKEAARLKEDAAIRKEAAEVNKRINQEEMERTIRESNRRNMRELRMRIFKKALIVIPAIIGTVVLIRTMFQLFHRLM